MEETARLPEIALIAASAAFAPAKVPMRAMSNCREGARLAANKLPLLMMPAMIADTSALPFLCPMGNKRQAKLCRAHRWRAVMNRQSGAKPENAFAVTHQMLQ